MGFRDVRKNRSAQGTNSKVFKEFNKWLKKNGHNKRDESFMVSSGYGEARDFGNVYYIFPIGKISYTWAETKDINMDDDRTNWKLDTVDYYDFNKDKFTLDKPLYGYDLLKPFPKYFHTDKGIDKAIKNKYEIWINCKEYMFALAENNWNSKKQLMVKY